MNETRCMNFYSAVIRKLSGSGIPFLIGGACAFGRYTGIFRDTKDLDIFVKAEDCANVLALFSEEGYETELYFSHWIGKIRQDEYFVDVIFSSGNGLCRVDDDWFRYSRPADYMGTPVRLCPPEEMIWQKGFIQERHRYDGADIMHLIRSCAATINWSRLIDRFGAHWRVLFSHLILFGFVYPSERDMIPFSVLQTLSEKIRMENEELRPKDKVCQGTLLSLKEYLFDIQECGYEDARLSPRGFMSQDQIDQVIKVFLKEAC